MAKRRLKKKKERKREEVTCTYSFSERLSFGHWRGRLMTLFNREEGESARVKIGTFGVWRKFSTRSLARKRSNSWRVL